MASDTQNFPVGQVARGGEVGRPLGAGATTTGAQAETLPAGVAEADAVAMGTLVAVLVALGSAVVVGSAVVLGWLVGTAAISVVVVGVTPVASFDEHADNTDPESPSAAR